MKLFLFALFLASCSEGTPPSPPPPTALKINSASYPLWRDTEVLNWSDSKDCSPTTRVTPLHIVFCKRGKFYEGIWPHAGGVNWVVCKKRGDLTSCKVKE